MNRSFILQENLNFVVEATFIDWNALAHKTFFITGATGLIGATLIKSLNHANMVKNLDIKVLALVRDKQRATEKFTDILADGMLQFVVGNVEELPQVEEVWAARRIVEEEQVPAAAEFREQERVLTFRHPSNLEPFL